LSVEREGRGGRKTDVTMMAFPSKGERGRVAVDVEGAGVGVEEGQMLSNALRADIGLGARRKE